MKIDIVPPWTRCIRCDVVYGQEHHCSDLFRLYDTDLRACTGCGAFLPETNLETHRWYECQVRREELHQEERDWSEHNLIEDISKLDRVAKSIPGIPVTVHIDFYHLQSDDDAKSGSIRIEGKGRTLVEALHDAYRSGRRYIEMMTKT